VRIIKKKTYCTVNPVESSSIPVGPGLLEKHQGSAQMIFEILLQSTHPHNFKELGHSHHTCSDFVTLFPPLRPPFLRYINSLIAMISPKSDLHQSAVHLAEESSDEEAMSDEHSMTETSGKESHASSTSGELSIGRQETKAVNRSKLVVYLALLVAAAAMGTATYFYMAMEEQDDFESEVRNICS
jgi:hypothetical protein